jgi:hypothetical protein
LWLTGDQDRAAIARASVGVPWWNDVAFAGYRSLVEQRRFLIGGDWNTARYVDAEGVPSPAGAEFLDRAAAVGWVDLTLFGEGREGRTWYGSGARQKSPRLLRLLAEAGMKGDVVKLSDALIREFGVSGGTAFAGMIGPVNRRAMAIMGRSLIQYPEPNVSLWRIAPEDARAVLDSLDRR